MRSKKQKEPTGSAFVEFGSEEDLEKFLKLPKKALLGQIVFDAI